MNKSDDLTGITPVDKTTNRLPFTPLQRSVLLVVIALGIIGIAIGPSRSSKLPVNAYYQSISVPSGLHQESASQLRPASGLKADAIHSSVWQYTYSFQSRPEQAVSDYTNALRHSSFLVQSGSKATVSGQNGRISVSGVAKGNLFTVVVQEMQ